MLSNLGMYQTIVTLMKKTGGPKVFLSLAAFGTIGTWEIIKKLGKEGLKKIRKALEDNQDVTVTVTEAGDVVVSERNSTPDLEPDFQKVQEYEPVEESPASKVEDGDQDSDEEEM